MSHYTKKFKEFRILDWSYDASDCSARFRYAFGEEYHFEELLRFKNAPKDLPEQSPQLKAVFAQLHIALGVSYYKAFAPDLVSRPGSNFTIEEAEFFEKLYRKGLAEFAYANSLTLSQLKFETNNSKHVPLTGKLNPGIVVPIGGGKDSLLTVELLKRANKPFSVFSFGNHSVLHEMAASLAVPYINVERHICPNLIALNKSGALNGHVPISGIIGFVLAASAIIYGFDTAVVSHESSSSVENLISNGEEINHQYSKSLEYEKDFQSYISKFLPDFAYFSLIRPLSELQILQSFSKLTHYHQDFTSCNRNFSITTHTSEKWCGDCPKCRFTFLGLAAFMKPKELQNIFGRNLLDDPTQTDGFDALLGWSSHKPFECVGTYEEAIAAFSLAAENKEWQESYQVKRFISEILPELDDTEGSRHKALHAHGPASIPLHFKDLLNAA